MSCLHCISYRLVKDASSVETNPYGKGKDSDIITKKTAFHRRSDFLLSVISLVYPLQLYTY